VSDFEKKLSAIHGDFSRPSDLSRAVQKLFDEIEKLKAERDEYRDALKDILDKWNMEDVFDTAREVLKKYEVKE
jgi:phage pi2 protein 07